MVAREVLDALGPQGVVLNIAHGTLVDPQAVADALRDERIWAAALDVYEFEPTPPVPLLEFESAVLPPTSAASCRRPSIPPCCAFSRTPKPTSQAARS